MAGMYPENEEITIFGEKVQWPGVDKNGKFTNGSFSDPHEPPSFIPAGTINLILDNLSGLITKLGGIPDNSSVEQLAGVFTSDIKPNAGIMRDGAGRAKVSAPDAEDDIARKAEVDAEKQARTQGDNAIYGQLSSHTGNKSNPHGVTAAQVGLGNVDNVRDNQKSVKYAETAGSAKADGGNADSVGGYKAGNGVNMLVPVVAFNVGETGGYIKLANGLLIQWGRVRQTGSSGVRLSFIGYSKIPILLASAESYGLGSWTESECIDKSSGTVFCRGTNGAVQSYINWLTIGF